MQAISVTVIIPMYNLERYIAACLGSLRQQSLNTIEILCVDDGSADGTESVVRKCMAQDSRIRLIRQSHAGQSAARNAALSQARGDYVYFLDGDDSIVPTALEEMLSFAQEHRLDMLAFDASNTYETPEMAKAYPQYGHLYRRGCSYPAETDGPSLFRSMQANREYYCAPPTYLFRRAFLEKCGLRFCEGIIHEDELFTLQAFLRAGRAGYLHRTLFLRLLREGSTMTRPPDMRDVNGYLTVYDRLEEELEAGSIDRETQERVSEKLVDFLRQAVGIYRRLPEEHDPCLWPHARMQVIENLFMLEERVLTSGTYRLGRLLGRPLAFAKKRFARIHA